MPVAHDDYDFLRQELETVLTPIRSRYNLDAISVLFTSSTKTTTNWGEYHNGNYLTVLSLHERFLEQEDDKRITPET